MQERFAVLFRDGGAAVAGALEVGEDWLRLRGRAASGMRELEMQFSELSEVRRGCGPSERLNGYPTLKPGCLAQARKLLAKGPPIDPASLGLSGHEVYLGEGEAVFAFHGRDVRAQVGQAIRHPAMWRAGLAWQRCFAAPPRILETAELSFEGEPAYRWLAPDQEAPG